MLLLTLLDEYCVSRGIQPSTREYFRRCVVQFERSVPDPTVCHLNADVINGFLHGKRGADAYRRSLRRGLVALWWFAAERGMIPPPGPRAVARVPVRRKPVHTWAAMDVVRLRHCARSLTGEFRNSRIPRGMYFDNMIAGAWYLGLSQIDLHAVEIQNLVDGNLTISRHKTGSFCSVGLPRSDWEATLKLAELSGIGKPWPAWGSRTIFSRVFAQIVNAAGLSGPWKTIRASAGTAYEIANPGMGHVFLGNTRDVFLRSYYDARREPATLPHAPLLPSMGDDQ